MLTYGYFVVWAMEDLEEVQLFVNQGHKKAVIHEWMTA